MPLENRATVRKGERSERGREKQAPFYGDALQQHMKTLPGKFAEAIPRMLTE